MTYEELQAKHDRLVNYVRRMRGHQKEWFRYHTRDDLDRARKLEREVDKLIDAEVKEMKSGQRSLF